MITVIKNGCIVNENKKYEGDVVIENDRIADIVSPGDRVAADEVYDAAGKYVIPGVIDTHVHFREPGMTDKADIFSESRAAAAGGVTSYFEMPNTKPQTTTLEALEEKRAIAQRDSAVNYSFFFGATADNVDTIRNLDARRVCGVKVFMGSSTGNMLVDNRKSLVDIFSSTSLPIVTHCEDSAIIDSNAQAYREKYGDGVDVKYHPEIRSEEACYKSTELAVKLARQTGAKLHVAHISTARELSLFVANNLQTSPEDAKISAEVCLPHLLFTDQDYLTLGSLVKCNPAVKTVADRNALRAALNFGKIRTIATDHAPHRLADKQGGALQAASGMPFVQFSLISMLDLTRENVLSIERVVELMSHNPAQLFDVEDRGFLRPGAFADIAIVAPGTPWPLYKDAILSKCGWSPMEGHVFTHRVERTYCNGKCVYDAATGINDAVRGREITFSR